MCRYALTSIVGYANCGQCEVHTRCYQINGATFVSDNWAFLLWLSFSGCLLFTSGTSDDSLNDTSASVNDSSSLDHEHAQNWAFDEDDDFPADSHHGNRSSLSPKHKRQHRDQSLSSSSSSSDVVAADFQHTKFGVALTHHVTAFITWPQSPDAVCSRGRKVVGYRLRYRRVGDSGYVSRRLADNVLTLTELQPNTRYRYQLQYVTDPPGESLWSQESELDTTP